MSGSGHRVDIVGVSQRFADYVAVNDVSLTVGAGELVALLGPSGCGKSTLLRIIAGFIQQTEGSICFDGDPVDGLAANRRGVGIVFQNYALFPHMTVRQNIAYGLEARKWKKPEIATRVEEMLAKVHMEAFGDRYPRQLSGGQQQRIALARCLATDPKILLLDEPFAALDKNLRFDMQIEVKRLQRESGITTVMVTHDQEEALSMADRIAVMNKGRLEQVASPTEVYDNPTTLFVNQFVGSTNLLPGTLVSNGPEGSRIRFADGAMMVAASTNLSPGVGVLVALRPEQVALSETATETTRPARIKSVLPLGAQIAYDIELLGGGSIKAVIARVGGQSTREPGDAIHIAPISPARCHVFPAQP